MRIYIYIYIYIYYIYIKLYTKTAAKEAVLLPVKSSSDDDPGFRHGFGAEASLPLTQGAPTVSHITTRLYCLICTNAISVQMQLQHCYIYIYILIKHSQGNEWDRRFLEHIR